MRHYDTLGLKRLWGGADLRFCSPQPDTITTLHCESTDIYWFGVLRSVRVYFPAFAGVRRIYPRWNGQVELTWMAG